MKLKLTLIGLVAIVATCPVAVRGANGTATDAGQTAAATTDAKPAADTAPLSKSAQEYLEEKAATANTQPTTVADTASPAAAATPTVDAPVAAAPAAPAAQAEAAVAAAPVAPVTAPTPAAPVVAEAPAAPAAPALVADTTTAATPATTTTTTTTTAVTTPAAAPAPAATATETNAAHDPNAVIPLIVMDEVPLIDAIKNLARQASLNYMLDPKITSSYGAPGADGAVKAQPTVSLRWENLTADQALSAVLDNNNLTIVDDPKTHIARITVKDPAAPDPLVTKIIQLKYSSATNMVANASSILLDKRSKVIADNRTSQLVVVATEKEMATIDDLVARLDTPTKQVLIEARIVETSKNPTSAKGVDWSGTLQAQHFAVGNNVLGGQSGHPYSSQLTVTTNIAGGFISQTTYGANNPIISPGLLVDTARGLDPTTAFLNADGASAVLSFLNNNFDGTVLSTPRAVTLDNEEATLEVTTAQPIFQTTAGTQGSPGGSQVLYTNLGTILHVTPRISANNTISLKVIPEVSDVAGTITKTVGGLVNQADVYDIRRIETRVLIPSGNTLVMGGLVGDNRSKTDVKVPVMGDIPFLGALFRQDSKTQNKKNLIIFITPTIVQSEDFQPTETSFLKTKIPNMKSSDFGAWDSGEPQDWSKLMHPKKDKPIEDANTDIPTTN
jgi:type IV pilus assembly protein PilQ